MSSFFNFAKSIKLAVQLLVMALGPSTCFAQTQQSDQEIVPFIGCPSSGQGGALAAPEDHSPPVRLNRATARQLALYATDQLRVLAPRGWHCLGMYGSNGASLIVSPDGHDPEDFVLNLRMLAGPGVHLSLSSSATSGRFDIAEISARIFPSQADFVQRIVDEGFELTANLPRTPFPKDSLTRHSPTDLEFFTPARTEGLGTMSRLKVNELPIHGWVSLIGSWHDMIKLNVRLPEQLDALSGTIIQSARRWYSVDDPVH